LAKPVEIFTILKILRLDIFQPFKPFGARYCDPKFTPFGIDNTCSPNVKTMHFILPSLMIRRLKKDVLNELPPKKRYDSKIITQVKVLFNKASKIDNDSGEVLKRLDVEDEHFEESDKDGLNCITKAY
jgi:hypothetical protein